MKLLWLVETLLLLSCVQLCLSQHSQGGQWTGANRYIPQYYSLYPVRYQNAMSSGAGMGYSSSNHFRSAGEESDPIIKSAMVPLNSVVSSGPAQTVLMPSYFSMDQPSTTQQRSAVSGAAPTNKKPNCTTGCSAARSATEEEIKTDPQSLPNFQIPSSLPNFQRPQDCECQCTRDLLYALLPYLSHNRYQSQSTAPQYPQSIYSQQFQNAYQQLQKAYLQYKNYYDQNQKSRQSHPTVGHYSPTPYNTYPNPNYSYYQPNYQMGYYS